MIELTIAISLETFYKSQRLRNLQFKWLLFFFVFGCFYKRDTEALSTNDYQRYVEYPEYCSTPEQMNQRRILPVRQDNRVGETRLVSVTAIIRHGARTSLGHHTCWEGYWTTAETSVWDCEITTRITTAPPNTVSKEEGLQIAGGREIFLFDKKYDSLRKPDGTTSNILNGTCQAGQLLRKGYDQSYRNGQILREAYLYDDGASPIQHNAQMRLFPTKIEKATAMIRFRSDDDQRTLMSGQALILGLLEESTFSPLVQIHLADRGRDILSINKDICPKLTELGETSQNSREYLSFASSDEAALMHQFMNESFGRILDHPLACLMTTICNDFSLPNVFDDYPLQNEKVQLHRNDTNAKLGGKYGLNRFQRLFQYDVQNVMTPLQSDNAALLKLAMGPLWAEILDLIRAVTEDSRSKTDGQAPRFHLVSAHDTTVSALLSTLGGAVWNVTDWPPYAAMVVLEVHEIVGGRTNQNIFSSDFAFRLLYNGRVLTTTVPGCDPHADLCDITVLYNILHPFASRSRDCAPRNSPKHPWQEHISRGLHTRGIGTVLVSVTLAGILTGSILACWIVACPCPYLRHGSISL